MAGGPSPSCVPLFSATFPSWPEQPPPGMPPAVTPKASVQLGCQLPPRLCTPACSVYNLLINRVTRIGKHRALLGGCEALSLIRR